MVLRLQSNVYRGVNAHLHSDFQSRGGWASFHTAYINNLARELNRVLPSGYLAGVEEALQLNEIQKNSETRLRPGGYVCTPENATAVSTEAGTVITRPLKDTLDLVESVHYDAIMIYSVGKNDMLEREVTRIETLCPTSKYGSGYIHYRDRRNATLRHGISLVEIDYLHETESPVKGLASYPQFQSGAYPYAITVNCPIPDIETGTATIYQFSVDAPIPVVKIPLLNGDALELDMNGVYNTTVDSLTGYTLQVDYADLPVNFESYSPADGKRIQEIIARLRENGTSARLPSG